MKEQRAALHPPLYPNSALVHGAQLESLGVCKSGEMEWIGGDLAKVFCAKKIYKEKESRLTAKYCSDRLSWMECLVVQLVGLTYFSLPGATGSKPGRVTQPFILKVEKLISVYFTIRIFQARLTN